jgi:cell wall-associated NlpC family hydrolase
MKKLLLLFLVLFCFSNCKSTKKRTEVVLKKPKSSSTIIGKDLKKNTSEEKEIYNIPEKPEPISIEEKIIDYAKSFEGVKYRFGGSNYDGIDCSGLVFEAFKAHDIYLPRISRDMAKQGDKIDLKDTKKGDLLFFKTGRNRRNAINHVGLVTEIKNNNIYFIHSTTSKGVIISSLNEDYWLNSFFEVRSFL